MGVSVAFIQCRRCGQPSRYFYPTYNTNPITHTLKDFVLAYYCFPYKMTSSQAVSRRTPEAMQLLLDYQSKFPVDADPSCNGWPYNYDDECCPCPKPTPRPFHATFYLICHHTNHPIDDMKAFFQEVCHFMRRSVEVQIETDSDDEDRVAVTLVETRGGDHEVLARGSVDREGCTGPDRTGDPNIGFYAEFVASTQEGCQFLFHCRMSCTPGYSGKYYVLLTVACVMSHESTINLVSSFYSA